MKFKKSLLATLPVLALSLFLYGCTSTESLDTASLQKELEQTKKELSEYKSIYGDLITDSTAPREDDSTLVISSKNLYPVLYNQDQLVVTADSCEYTKGAEYVRFTLQIENATSQTVDIGYDDIHIGDVQLTMGIGNGVDNYSTVKPGQNGTYCYYITANQLESGNVTDFDKIECTFFIRDEDGEELISQDLVIMRDAFIEYSN